MAPHHVLLTGASGTLGRNLLDLMRPRADFRVTAVVRHGAREIDPGPNVAVEAVDYDDRAGLRALLDRVRPTCVVHAAATGMAFPRAEWFDLVRFNVDLTVALCEGTAALPGCHFVYVGTGLAYRPQDRPLVEEDPLDTAHPYGASKAAADLLVRAAAAEFGVPLTVVRPFSFTGLGDDRTRLFATLLRAAADRRPFALTAGTQVRDHCSARDVAAGILAAIERPPADRHVPRAYNLGSGSREPLRAMLERVAGELGLAIDLEFGAREPGRFDPAFLVADHGRATRELGWRPRHNLAHAVWQLARESFPTLEVREPEEAVSTC